MVLTDLVSSSFRLVELIIELQEEFDVRFQQSDMHDVTTVGQLVQLVNSRTIHATSG
jgi:acyl carrier protein